jgi:hypothetical protein
VAERTVTVELTIEQAENLRQCVDCMAQQTFGNKVYGGFKFSEHGWRNAALADKALFDAITAAESNQDGGES